MPGQMHQTARFDLNNLNNMYIIKTCTWSSAHSLLKTFVLFEHLLPVLLPFPNGGNWGTVGPSAPPSPLVHFLLMRSICSKKVCHSLYLHVRKSFCDDAGEILKANEENPKLILRLTSFFMIFMSMAFTDLLFVAFC